MGPTHRYRRNVARFFSDFVIIHITLYNIAFWLFVQNSCYSNINDDNTVFNHIRFKILVCPEQK